jgi:hypothetical protein
MTMAPSVQTGTCKTVFILLLILMSFNGFSQNRTIITSTAKPLKIEYNYPSDRAIKYLSVSKVVQILDIEGQMMQVNANSAFGCSVKYTGNDKNNFVLEIGIDTLAQTVDGPQGSSGNTVSDIKGRTFKMKITPQGKESDFSDAEKVAFMMGESGATNITQFILDFFPDVPATSVKVGDTWNSTDSLYNKTASTTMSASIKSINKFEGIEVVNGIECMKITSAFSGDRYMTAQTQGMDILTRGPYTGTGILFFAVKEGYFIKQSNKTSLKGNIEISGPQEMSFPIVIETYSTTEFVK